MRARLSSFRKVVRGGRVTSALIGASRPEQVVDCVGALKNLSFTPEELGEIDRFAGEGNLNIWAASARTEGPVALIPNRNPQPLRGYLFGGT